MKNKEKWANELIGIFMTMSTFAVDKYGTPHSCVGFKCSECAFNKLADRCSVPRKEWLEKEYSEPVYLTRFEHDLLIALNHKWKYITRDKDGQLSLFNNKPIRVSELCIWVCPLMCADTNWRLVLHDMFNLNVFPMIKWVDTIPWSIEKLLSLPVKD